MNGVPRWARYAMYGAVVAVMMDYMLGPSLRQTFRLQ